MILILRLTVAIAIASILNFGVYLFLKQTTTFSLEELAFIRLFTGIPLGVVFSNWAIKNK